MPDVICSYSKLEVGQRYFHPVTGPHWQDLMLGFLVIRVATEDEYRQCLVDYGNPDETPFFGDINFYEILTD